LSTEPNAPTEEELRAAYEAELSRVTVTEMIMQMAASLLNMGARRMGLLPTAPGQPPQRDLLQAQDAIDGVRGLLEVLERRAPQECRPLRDALAQLQLAYAREAKDAPSHPAEDAPPAPAAPPAGDNQPQRPADESGPGPAESSGRLWVPGR
jgi:hypothetical protein